MKKISALLSALILITCIGFLALKNKSDKGIDNKKEPSVSVSATEQKEISISNKPINADEVKEENVFFFFNSTASFDPGQLCYTIDEMNESDLVDTIVKGIITDIDYVDINSARTILTVNVLESYKGNTAKEIKVYEDGGYVRLKDMLGEFKDKGLDLEKKLTKEQIENGLVDMKFCNAPYPKKGHQVILYLYKNPNKPPVWIADSYMSLGSVYGKFTLDKNTGQYKRPSEDMGSKFEGSISEVDMEKKLKNKFK